MVASAHLSKWYTNPDDDNALAVCIEDGCDWISTFLNHDEASELALGHAEKEGHLTSAERRQWRTATPSCHVTLVAKDKLDRGLGKYRGVNNA